MDQSELIEKITREVVTRLKEQGAPEGSRSGGESRAASSGGMTPDRLASFIDHTLLKPDATQDQIDTLCAEAVTYKFCSVCVNSSWVAHVARKLRGTGVKVCAVVGFPLGAMSSRSKAFETRNAIEDGAAEIDMVINVGALKSKNLKLVEEDIRAVRRACAGTTVLKVIFETCLLTDEEKILACEISKKAGADFVKTSTGFSTGGATVEDVALMRRTVGPALGVKASGGVKNFEHAVKMIQAGATRLGTSSGITIIKGGEVTKGY